MAHHRHHLNEQKTRIVVLVNMLAMLLEIGFGYYTKSMALLMDGWHMASHVLALGISLVAYHLAKNEKINSEKMFSLAGYTSAISLIIVSAIMIKEAVERLIEPVDVKFEEALIVAVIGLVVNGASVGILHHKGEHREHNIHAAYLHVLADTITSFLAITAITMGMLYDIYWLDAVSGLISALIIAKWGISLSWNSGKVLLGIAKSN